MVSLASPPLSSPPSSLFGNQALGLCDGSRRLLIKHGAPQEGGVSHTDLRALLDLIEAGRSTAEGEGLPSVVLEGVYGLVGCETVSFVDFDIELQVECVGLEFPTDPAEDESPDDSAFWRHYWECLPCCYPSISHDERRITTISDFYNQRQFHNTGMYADFLRPLGVEREMMMCISAPAGRSRRLIFFRGRGSDFRPRDRLLLSLMRPHLSELYQELERRRRAPELTIRQWELLQLVASGHSNAEIANTLVVSAATVRKHLENIFERLGVTSRTSAAARAFPPSPY